MTLPWSRDRALQVFNRNTDTTNTNFFGAGRAYSVQHIRTLIDGAVEAVEEGPEALARPLFDELLNEICKIAAGGPGDGMLVTVEVLAEPYRLKLQEQLASLPKKGRPPGAGKWESNDRPLIELMRAAIVDRRAKSKNAAAMLYVDKAGGTATDKAKAERLCILYNSIYPD